MWFCFHINIYYSEDNSKHVCRSRQRRKGLTHFTNLNSVSQALDLELDQGGGQTGVYLVFFITSGS